MCRVLSLSLSRLPPRAWRTCHECSKWASHSLSSAPSSASPPSPRSSIAGGARSATFCLNMACACSHTLCIPSALAALRRPGIESGSISACRNRVTLTTRVRPRRRRHLGGISATPRLHFSCVSAASRSTSLLRLRLCREGACPPHNHTGQGPLAEGDAEGAAAAERVWLVVRHLPGPGPGSGEGSPRAGAQLRAEARGGGGARVRWRRGKVLPRPLCVRSCLSSRTSPLGPLRAASQASSSSSSGSSTGYASCTCRNTPGRLREGSGKVPAPSPGQASRCA